MLWRMASNSWGKSDAPASICQAIEIIRMCSCAQVVFVIVVAWFVCLLLRQSSLCRPDRPQTSALASAFLGVQYCAWLCSCLDRSIAIIELNIKWVDGGLSF